MPTKKLIGLNALIKFNDKDEPKKVLIYIDRQAITGVWPDPDGKEDSCMIFALGGWHKVFYSQKTMVETLHSINDIATCSDEDSDG